LFTQSSGIKNIKKNKIRCIRIKLDKLIISNYNWYYNEKIGIIKRPIEAVPKLQFLGRQAPLVQLPLKTAVL
jgi:hypothetical protein